MTKQQQAICDMVVQGTSNKEIADRLFTTEKNVKFHMGSILKALEVTSRAQLIVKCLKDTGVSDNEFKMFKELLK